MSLVMFREIEDAMLETLKDVNDVRIDRFTIHVDKWSSEVFEAIAKVPQHIDDDPIYIEEFGYRENKEEDEKILRMKFCDANSVREVLELCQAMKDALAQKNQKRVRKLTANFPDMVNLIAMMSAIMSAVCGFNIMFIIAAACHLTTSRTGQDNLDARHRRALECVNGGMLSTDAMLGSSLCRDIIDTVVEMCSIDRTIAFQCVRIYTYVCLCIPKAMLNQVEEEKGSLVPADFDTFHRDSCCNMIDRNKICVYDPKMVRAAGLDEYLFKDKERAEEIARQLEDEDLRTVSVDEYLYALKVCKRNGRNIMMQIANRPLDALTNEKSIHLLPKSTHPKIASQFIMTIMEGPGGQSPDMASSYLLPGETAIEVARRKQLSILRGFQKNPEKIEDLKKKAHIFSK